MYAKKGNKDACKIYHVVWVLYVNHLKNNFMPAKLQVTVIFKNVIMAEVV